jgi:hypothetical protein
MAIVMRKRCYKDAPSAMSYNVIVWLDYQPDLHLRPKRDALLSSVFNITHYDLNLKDCGSGGAGFLHFLLVIARTIEQWSKCWDSMMDKIDDTISVQVCLIL